MSLPAAVVFGAALLGACDGMTASPSEPLTSFSPAFFLATDPPVREAIWVCVEGAAGAYSFSGAQIANNGNAPVITSPLAVNSGSCALLATDNDGVATVRVDEVSRPAGTAFLSGTLTEANGPTAQNPPNFIGPNPATLPVDARVGLEWGARIVLTYEEVPEGCTFTQGWYKNHDWDGSATLGTVAYTEAQLRAILDTPVKGNGLISLAHQLITAKLNIDGGADPSAISQAIADADALIGALVVPPIGSGYLDPSVTSALVDALSDFNEGITGPGHCDG